MISESFTPSSGSRQLLKDLMREIFCTTREIEFPCLPLVSLIIVCLSIENACMSIKHDEEEVQSTTYRASLIHVLPLVTLTLEINEGRSSD